MYRFAHKAYLAFICGWFWVCMKWLENWWLSGSEICLVAVAFMFYPIFHFISSCFTYCLPSFFGYFPCFSWCFSLIIDIVFSLKSEENKISIPLAPRKPVNSKAKKFACPAIDRHCMSIQFIHKLTLIKQRQEIFFLSFRQSTIYGIIIIQNRLTISRQRKLEERKWFCDHLKWCKFCKCPANIYLLKVNNRNTGKRCEICSKLTKKTLERHQWHGSGVFIVTFEYISHLFLVFLLFTLNK